MDLFSALARSPVWGDGTRRAEALDVFTKKMVVVSYKPNNIRFFEYTNNQYKTFDEIRPKFLKSSEWLPAEEISKDRC